MLTRSWKVTVRFPDAYMTRNDVLARTTRSAARTFDDARFDTKAEANAAAKRARKAFGHVASAIVVKDEWAVTR